MTEENLEQQTQQNAVGGETQQGINDNTEVPNQLNNDLTNATGEVMNNFAKYVINHYKEANKNSINRQSAIEKNLSGYNADNYLKNKDFMTLYSEAFDALGDKLDTKRFIGLVDNYVASMIAAKQKEQSAKAENSSLTDSFEYKNGTSGKSKDTLKFQDVSPEDLPKYLAQYIK